MAEDLEKILQAADYIIKILVANLVILAMDGAMCMDPTLTKMKMPSFSWSLWMM